MASKIKNIYKATQKQITTIFFDLDNTLIQTRKGDNKAISKVSENKNLIIFRHSKLFYFDYVIKKKSLINHMDRMKSVLYEI